MSQPQHKFNPKFSHETEMRKAFAGCSLDDSSLSKKITRNLERGVGIKRDRRRKRK